MNLPWKVEGLALPNERFVRILDARGFCIARIYPRSPGIKNETETAQFIVDSVNKSMEQKK